MADRAHSTRTHVTKGQWAAASAGAFALHLLLAWLLVSSVPVLLDAPAGQDGGIRVGSLTVNGAGPPMLREVGSASNETAMATPAVRAPTMASPVRPPVARPMTEVVPAKTTSETGGPPADKPTPRRQTASEPQKSQPAPKPKRRASLSKKRSAESHEGPAGSARAGGQRGDSRTGADQTASPVPGNPKPRYPRIARSRGQEGRVLIRVSVLENGRVGSAAVAESSGHGALDRAALNAVKRWRFKPARRAGQAVTATLTIPVVFRLEG